MKIGFLSVLLFISLSSWAAVFTVSSNADAGVGTLRQAILDANANGINDADYINFSLPGTLREDVTISLMSALPKLTSKIVIDATTQPSSLLGSTSIRIFLTRASANFFDGLVIDGVSDVEIYGIYFNNFLSPEGIPADDRTAAINLKNASNVIIGKPSMQNGFGNNYTSLISPTSPNFLRNISVSSNIIGLDATGIVANPNSVGIDLSYLSNSVIGGDTEAHGNVISSNSDGVSLGAMSGKVQFSHNIIGADVTKTKLFAVRTAVGVFANGEFVDLFMSNNYIVSHSIGVRLDNLKSNYLLTGNTIGESVLTGHSKYGIELYNCNSGGINDGNIIGHNDVGVFADRSYAVSILKNSFFCNKTAIETINIPSGKTITPSRISSITATGASGIYLPNATVELFYTDECIDCQGKTWLATLTTDDSGAWNYSGPITGPITSMGTNADGATSSFSKPQLDDSGVAILGVFCGRTTGSVTKIEVFDASVFNWYNASGTLVGTSKDLSGVGAGTYQLKTGQLGACDVVSKFYTIDSESNGINDANRIITDTFCASSNGSITNISVADELSRTWYNSADEPIGTDEDLLNVPAGDYYFKAGLGTCEVTSKIYTIKNIVHQYKVRTVNIQPETCGNKNGSVTIMDYESERPNSFEWYDATGALVSTDESINALSAGIYSLFAKGNNGCANKVGDFEVPVSASSVLDYSKFAQYLSCDGKTVSTTGIAITGDVGPYRYEWVTDAGEVVSNNLNLSSVGAGSYTLRVTDKYGCVTIGNTIDFVALTATVLKVPNSFSPNNDAINDNWHIEGAINYPNADFTIFARNGSRVFYSKGYNVPFDGRFNGKQLPAGVYYYVIDLKSNCGKLSGSLTLIR